jgi:hypothetical protein
LGGEARFSDAAISSRTASPHRDVYLIAWSHCVVRVLQDATGTTTTAGTTATTTNYQVVNLGNVSRNCENVVIGNCFESNQAINTKAGSFDIW